MSGLPRFEEFFQTGIEHLALDAVPQGDGRCPICLLDYPEVDPWQDETNLWWLSQLTTLLNDVDATPALRTIADLDRPDLPNNNPVRVRRCNHVFGLGCLRHAMAESTNCPLCRRALYQVDEAAERAEETRRILAVHRSMTLRDYLTDDAHWVGQTVVVTPGYIAEMVGPVLRRVAKRLDLLIPTNRYVADRVRHVIICAANLLDGEELDCSDLADILEQCVEAAVWGIVVDQRLAVWAMLTIRYLVAELRIMQEMIPVEVFLDGFPAYEVELIDEVVMLTLDFP